MLSQFKIATAKGRDSIERAIAEARVDKTHHLVQDKRPVLEAGKVHANRQLGGSLFVMRDTCEFGTYAYSKTTAAVVEAPAESGVLFLQLFGLSCPPRCSAEWCSAHVDIVYPGVMLVEGKAGGAAVLNLRGTSSKGTISPSALVDGKLTTVDFRLGEGGGGRLALSCWAPTRSRRSASTISPSPSRGGRPASLSSRVAGYSTASAWPTPPSPSPRSSAAA